MMILAVGDTHAQWINLNKLINKKNPDIILQCGDFGWWPKFHNTNIISSDEYESSLDDIYFYRKKKKFDQYGIKNRDCKIYWCDGNHEDHWSLKEIKKPEEVMTNIYYMPRGSTLRLPTGENVMFIGGALSIDKDWRTIGHDWFPEEQITHGEVYNLPDERVDIVISHTCPREFNKYIPQLADEKFKDSSQDALSFVLERYKPERWFFSHFHISKEGRYNQTEWTCLNQEGESNWWKQL